MSSAILFLLLLQATPMDRRPEISEVPLSRREALLTPSSHRAQAEQRDEADRVPRLADRFNHLVETMADFAEKYNQGHTIDIKKLKAMKKAWHDLEQSDPWFRRDQHE